MLTLFFCIDNCQACYLFRDDELDKEIDPFIDEDVRVYEYDVNLGANEIFFTPFFQSAVVAVLMNSQMKNGCSWVVYSEECIK